MSRERYLQRGKVNGARKGLFTLFEPNKKLPSVRAARMWSEQLKKVGITYFSFVFTIFFSL